MTKWGEVEVGAVVRSGGKRWQKIYIMGDGSGIARYLRAGRGRGSGNQVHAWDYDHDVELDHDE